MVSLAKGGGGGGAKTPTIAARMSVRGAENVRASFDSVKKSGEETFGALKKSAASVGDAAGKTAQVAVETTKAATSIATTSLGIIGTTLSGIANIATFLIDTVLGIAGAIAKGAVLVAGAAAGAYAIARQWTFATAEGNDAVLRQAQAIGMSVESLSRWQAAIRIAGGDANAIGSAFESIRGKMIDVAHGVDGADKSFRQLNLSVRDTDGRLKGTEELFEESIEQLAKIQDEGRRASAAYDLFGSSAKDMLPALRRGSAGLKELMADSERYGTALNTSQALEANALLEKKRQLDEALKGTANRISFALLPVFTETSGALADWLESNGGLIEKWAQNAGKWIRGVVQDVGGLFAGNGNNFNNSWMDKLYAPAQQLKSIFLDLGDAMQGEGLGKRNPWLNDLVDTAGEAWKTLERIVQEIGMLTGVAVNGMPQMETMLRNVSIAFQSFRDGLDGKVGEFAWVSNIAVAAQEAGRAIGGVSQIINDHKETITAVLGGLLFLMADGLEAVRAILGGTELAGDNAFNWLPGLVTMFQAAMDGIMAAGAPVWDAILAAWDQLQGAGLKIIDTLDWIAKSLGLGDWKTLGILLVVGQLTGALGVLQSFGTLLAASAVFANNLLGILATLGQGAVWVAGLIAAALGIPAGILIGVVAIFAAMIATVVIFWDDYVSTFQGAWEGLKFIFGSGIQALVDAFWVLADAVGAVFNAIGGAGGAAWGVIEAVFGPAARFLGDIAMAIWKPWNDLWTWIFDGAGKAWNGVTDVFGGLLDFFTDPLGKLGKMWDNLWDGVKNGALGAWDAVKGFFGFGGGENGNGESLPSYDVGTARVPGADGQPMQALIHGGERILTVAQNRQFGALLDSLANMTTLPETEFAQAPVAGGSRTSGSGLAPMPVSIAGRRIDGLQGTPSGIRQLQSAARRFSRVAAAPQTRWSMV